MSIGDPINQDAIDEAEEEGEEPPAEEYVFTISPGLDSWQPWDLSQISLGVQDIGLGEIVEVGGSIILGGFESGTAVKEVGGSLYASLGPALTNDDAEEYGKNVEEVAERLLEPVKAEIIAKLAAATLPVTISTSEKDSIAENLAIKSIEEVKGSIDEKLTDLLDMGMISWEAITTVFNDQELRQEIDDLMVEAIDALIIDLEDGELEDLSGFGIGGQLTLIGSIDEGVLNLEVNALFSMVVGELGIDIRNTGGSFSFGLLWDNDVASLVLEDFQLLSFEAESIEIEVEDIITFSGENITLNFDPGVDDDGNDENIVEFESLSADISAIGISGAVENFALNQNFLPQL